MNKFYIILMAAFLFVSFDSNNVLANHCAGGHDKGTDASTKETTKETKEDTKKN